MSKFRRRLMMAQGGEGGEVPQYSGYNIVGNPTIIDGILTIPYGSNSFVVCPQAFSPGTSPWKMQTKVVIPEYNGSNCDIVTSVNSSNGKTYGLVLERNGASANYDVYLSSGGTRWDLTGLGSLRNTMTPGSYDILVEFSGSEYRFGVKAEGGSWVVTTFSSSTPVVGGWYWGIGAPYTSMYRNLQIDLNATKVYIDGSLWWQPIYNA